MVFNYHNLKFFFGFFRSWYNSATTTDHRRRYGSCHYHFWRWFYELEMVMSTTNPSRFKPFYGIYGRPETIRKKGGITILMIILGVHRNFFKEVYQNDYHECFCNQSHKWCYGNKKSWAYHAILSRKNHWWASYHDRTFYTKKWFMVPFFWFFRKFRILLLIDSSEGVKKLLKNAAVFLAVLWKYIDHLPLFIPHHIFISDAKSNYWWKK